MSDRSPRQYSGKRIAVAGLFRTRCGLQRGAELMVADFRAQGTLASAVDLSRALHAPLTLEPPGLLEPDDLSATDPSDVIVHINPPLFSRALDLFPARVRRDCCIVAYWAWELKVLSAEWRHAATQCDAIWVPSPFVADAMEAGLPLFRGEIRVVPHPVDRDPLPHFTPEAKRIIRENHGLAPDQFVVGFSFAFGSNYARKNPTAAIDAFRLAFPEHDQRNRLLLRCHEVADHRRYFDHLRAYAGEDSRIDVIDAAERPFPIINFYNCLDVYLSLHRSEGYGLQIAEAAQSDVRVICTGWGLAPELAARPQVETVDSRLVPPLDPQGLYTQYKGALWAEPDTMQAARLLRRARDNRGAPL